MGQGDALKIDVANSSISAPLMEDYSISALAELTLSGSTFRDAVMLLAVDGVCNAPLNPMFGGLCRLGLVPYSPAPSVLPFGLSEPFAYASSTSCAAMAPSTVSRATAEICTR